MNRIKYLIILAFLFVIQSSFARLEYTINNAWRFSKDAPYRGYLTTHNDSQWDLVNIPHTWNADDADDDIPGFYRGSAWYRRNISLPKSYATKQVYIYFEGANQVTKVYVNGHYVGKHIGGYTRFNFDITRHLVFGEENLIAVEVTNEHDPNIPPLSADFTFFGGIYRDIKLVITDKVHISPNDNASSGVYLTTPSVTEKAASVNIRALIENSDNQAKEVVVEHQIVNPKGESVAVRTEKLKIKANERIERETKGIKIENPQLWDIDHPHLYKVYTQIKIGGKVLDEVVSTLGLRWFSFDPDKGFILNGRPRKLIGTCRHQDYFERGWAITDAMHERDIRLLKDMGGNFLRVSHYPQDPVVMELCDRYGIVTSVEIPVVNAITETEEFISNSVNMAREMIRQDFNHPSVMIWAYMNEVLLRQPYSDAERLAPYYVYVEKCARALENLLREEDSSRYTMMAYHNAPDRYAKANLTTIPMIQGWNLYQGWYERDITEFERILDRLHGEYPEQTLMVTEYGPGVDPRLHSYDSSQFDFTQEYGLIYHRHYLREMLKRPFIAGSSLWNLNDFYSEPRVDAVPHVNNKGITGLNRELKDSYLFYKTNLSGEDQLFIGQAEWENRGGADNGEGYCVQPLPIFTNQKSVTLKLNNKTIATLSPDADGVAMFDVPFVDGENRLVATAGELVDTKVVDFRMAKATPAEFTELNVSLGDNRYFDDREAGTAWIPEQAYTKGSWGYVGGEVYHRKGSGFLGSSARIYGTDCDPIFQTQRVGIESFKADVPDGRYSIHLYWAELDSNVKQEALAYNLGANSVSEGYEERRFDVSINSQLVAQSLSIASDVGFSRAMISKYEVIVRDGKGISIDFEKIKGEPVLNAIRLYRNY